MPHKVSYSPIEQMRWFLKLAVLLGGKTLARKTLVSSFYVVIDPRGKEWSHVSPCPEEKMGTRRHIAPLEASLIFKVSQTSKNTERHRLGSSKGVPPNCDCCTMEMSASLSSQLLVVTGVLLYSMFGYGRLRWHNLEESAFVLLLLPPLKIWVAPFVILFCLFNLWKVLSISRSNLKRGFSCIN